MNGGRLSCPCGSGATTGAIRGCEHPMRRCGACGLLVRADLPTEAELARWFRDQYWTLSQKEQLGTARENLYGHALDCLQALAPEPGTLVDVGCGAGQLLALCPERGWRGIGFDPSAEAVAHARAMGLEAYAQTWPPCSLPDESAMAVTFINVLDVLRDPFAALQESWRILKPNGRLYIRVPNGPLHYRLKRLLSKAGLSHLPILNCYGFGRESFLYHLPRLGFAIVALRTAPPTQGDAYKPARLAEALLKRWLKATDRLTYRILSGLGLDRRAWGLSLEVVASKVLPATTVKGA